MQVESSQGMDAVVKGLTKMLHSSILVTALNHNNGNAIFEIDHDCGTLELFNVYTLKDHDGYFLRVTISGSQRSTIHHSEKNNSSFTIEQLDNVPNSSHFI